MEHSTFDPKTVARAYIEAVGNRQMDQVAALLHDDLEARIGDQAFTKQQWVAALTRLVAILGHNDIRQVIVRDEEACVVYDFVTDTPVGAVPSAELLNFEDGKIRTLRLVFETARWPEVLEVLQNRAVPA